MFHFHHVSISVTNLEASLKFYEEFGFKKVFFWESEDSQLKIAHLKLDSFLLELFCFKEYAPLPAEAKELETDLIHIGVKHFGIKVKSIEEIKNFVIKKGFAKNLEIKKGNTGIYYFFIKDPDGILLEFIQDDRVFS